MHITADRVNANLTTKGEKKEDSVINYPTRPTGAIKVARRERVTPDKRRRTTETLTRVPLSDVTDSSP